MAQFKILLGTLSLAWLCLQTALATAIGRAPTPRLPIAPGTTTSCNFWWDRNTPHSCERVPAIYGTTFEDFFRWNPSLKGNCINAEWTLSYCVEGPAAISGTQKPTSTGAIPSTTKAYNNGIPTLQPVQPGVVYNCNKFIQVKQDDTCWTLAERHDTTVVNIGSWNSLYGRGCNGLVPGSYACVSVKRGLAPPNPLPGIVGNCAKFYQIEAAETCYDIALRHQISTNEVAAWNSLTDKTCNSLKRGAYACISNSTAVEKPSPLQPGIIDVCDKFYQVKETDTCLTIAERFRINQVEVATWNSLNSKTCSGLALGAYACVSIAGHPDC